MPDEQPEARDPFFRAYRTVRSELAQGLRLAGSQIRVDETARALGISGTPVREALAMLAGERLVRGCRRQGYFVPQPSASELIQLYLLSEMHLMTAIRLQAGRRTSDIPLRGEEAGTLQSGSGLARVFITILARADCPLLLDGGALILERLASARLVEEPELARRIRDEIIPLVEERRFGALSKAVRAYHQSRRAMAMDIAEAIAALSRSASGYFRDMI